VTSHATSIPQLLAAMPSLTAPVRPPFANRRRRWFVRSGVLLALAAAFVLWRVALSASLTVTTTSDTVDGATTSIADLIATPGPDGAISLREALLAVNNTTGGPHTINFNIGGCGTVCTITPATTLPIIQRAVLIDGWSQPGWNQNPIVMLDGAGANDVGGLQLLNHTGSTIRGLIIGGIDSIALTLTSGGSHTIQGNWIGLNAVGTAARLNFGFGIYVDGSTNNQIGGNTPAQRNVISGNASEGIYVDGSTGNTISGNYIGTNAAGDAAVANGSHGVLLTAGSGSNTIGAVGAGNLISGNSGSGIRIDTASNGNSVVGNTIGLNAAGTAALPNLFDAVSVVSSNNTVIGGTAGGAGNVLSGNNNLGDQAGGVWTQNASGTVIQGNRIGTNAAGTAAFGNIDGIQIEGGANTTIGGTASGAGNLVSGNLRYGISIYGGATGVTVQGNLVGVDAAGTAAIANADHGIRIPSGTNGVVIGGTASGARNVIAANGGLGIELASNSNTVQGNYIGLAADGATALGNGLDGITVSGSGNLIGGGAAAARNVIAAHTNVANNSDGIYVPGSNNTIQGNYIGTDVTGTLNRGNYNGGVALWGSNNTVGGTNASEGNLLAFNRYGAFVTGNVSGNRILGNSIHSNSILGIELIWSSGAPNGVTTNDGVKSAGQPNLLMDFPVFTHATLSGSTLAVAGYVGSAANQSTFANSRVEVFVADPNATGNGQGRTYVGALTTGSNGMFSGIITVPGGVSIAAATTRITGTATDTSNNTSEFGPNFVVAVPGGRWLLDETSGTAANDSIAGNHGTYLNGVLLSRGAVGSCSTGSVQFDGVNDHVVIPHRSSYLLDNGTVAFWVKVDSLPGGSRGLFSKDSTGYDTGGHLTLWLNNNGTIRVRQQSTNATYEYNSTATIQVGQWNHIAYTWGAGGMRLYVNDGTPATNAYTGGLGSNSGGIGNEQPIVLGANSWSADDLVANNLTDWFAGYMSDVRLVEYALSAAEIDTVRSCGPPLNFTISGRVFEDVNYGGGIGRNRATAVTGGGSHRSGARVELYNADGSFNSSTTTDAGGNYSFTVPAAAYTVRVVNQTVSSARSGYTASLRAVQTFRTEAAAGIVNDVYDHVGGEIPALADAASNTTNATLASLTTATTTAQSITPVTVTNASLSGVDFGYSFNVVVNTNNGGQGSLRQYLNNANALADTGLAQIGLTAGVDNSVFMIADGTARPGLHAGYPSLFSSGVATIRPVSALPSISGRLNAQTQPGWTNRPLIEVDGSLAGTGTNGFTVSSGAHLRGFIINRFDGNGVQTSGTGIKVYGNWIGLDATGNAAAGNGLRGVHFNIGGNHDIGGSTTADLNVISGNGVSASGDSTTRVGIGVTGAVTVSVRGNYIGTNASGTAAVGNISHGIHTNNGLDLFGPNIVSGNGGWGIYYTTVGNNANARHDGTWIGVAADGGSPLGNGLGGLYVGGGQQLRVGLSANGSTTAGIIAHNNGVGVQVATGATGIRISGNAIFNNTALGIDLGGNGVTANDGAKTSGQANLLMDSPLITQAELNGTTLTVAGYVGSAAGQSTFSGARVEFFKSDFDASGFGEGQAYLGTLTADASGNFAGTLTVSGLTVNDRLTATAIDGSGNTSEFGANAIVRGLSITGTVFEDVNYGGGAGRDRATALAAGGSGRSGTRVELFDAAGNFVTSTTTDTNGAYVFNDLVAASFSVRVVNNSVTSARSGYTGGLLPVQTYRTDAATGTAQPIVGRVGGEVPSLADAGDGSTTLAALTTASTTAQSVSAVSTAAGSVAGVDFGFSFNVIVNTNDSDQGSLRQFITNSNALRNPGLALSGQPAGKDVSIFMIPSSTDPLGRAADPNFAGGRAVITVSSALPQITAADTTIDGTTQTTYVGNSNAGMLGTGGTVGVDALPFAQIPAPEVELRGSTSFDGISIAAANVGVRGLALYRFRDNIYVSGASGALIEYNVLGSSATAMADPGSGQRTAEQGLQANASTSGTARFNLVGFNGREGIRLQAASHNWTIQGNEIRGNGQTVSTEDGIGIGASNNSTISGNLIADNRSPGLDFFTGASGNTVTDNTVTNSNLGNSAENFGIRFVGASNNTLEANVITGSSGVGVAVQGNATGNRLTRNAIYANSSIGIDLDRNGVTANDGAKTLGEPNQRMDFPVLSLASYSTTTNTLQLTGYVGSAAGQALFANARVEFFKSNIDPSGYGEGQTYLGFLTTDANGNFSGTLNTTLIAANDRVTATATDGANNTSEFGPNFIVLRAADISGTVFEDLNYGGGIGRNRATALAAGGTGRPGARVELYDSAGTFLTAATTDGNGLYTFSGLLPGTYAVRAVNSTVTSARSGYTAALLAVQTFRTDAPGGSAVDINDRVGGEVPALADAGNGSSTLAALTTPTTTAQSVTAVTVGTADITAVDFGFSFNLVVNTNDSGQGSLRQFIANANALANTGLAIDGRIAGIDHAVFMIANGSASPGLRAGLNYFSGGVASIAPASALPPLTGAVVLDAQTQPGWSGTPIVELNGSGAGVADGLLLNASGSTIRGWIVNRFGATAVSVFQSSNHLIQGNYLGTNAAGTAASANSAYGVNVWQGAGNQIGGTAASHRNVISGNGNVGVSINGTGASNNTVSGNYIGTNAAGTAAVPNNNSGVFAGGSGTDNLIGGTATGAGNLISGNTLAGVYIGGAVTLQGNFIGTNAAGTAALPNAVNGVTLSGAVGAVIGGTPAGARNIVSGNTGRGISIESSAAAVQISGNYIGVSADGNAALGNSHDGICFDDNDGSGSVVAGNVISANGEDGITIRPGANSITITGNLIGTNAAGTGALGNVRYGIEVQETATIGGTTAAQRNVIAANGDDGIHITNSAPGTVIRGNYIGTNAAGTAALGNGDDGIRVGGTSHNVVIGGTAAGAGNLISGNANEGIELASTVNGAIVQGNRIGTNAAGTGAIANAETGIDIDGGSVHLIGGTTSGAGNVIAYNGHGGVSVDGGSGHAILGNSIHSNGRLGINLRHSGDNGYTVTANDGAKTAGAPNLLMDFPVFTNASWDGSVLRVRGYIGSAAGQSTFANSRVEVFVADNDSSGYGEGRTYVGATTADANGGFAFVLAPPTGVTIAVGAQLTATATDTANNTSEFSARFNVREYLPFRNGSFEDGNLGAKINDGDGSFWQLGNGSAAIDYWVVGGGLQAMETDYWNASHGARSVELNAGPLAGGYIEQTFDTEPGVTYSVFFDYTSSAACGPTRKSLRVSAAGTQQDIADYLVGGSAVIPPASGSPGVYGVYYNTALFRFTANNDLTTLRFTSLNDSYCGPIVDHVRVSAADDFINGSFELAGVDPGGGWASLAGGSTAINGWTVTGDSIDYGGSSQHTPTDGNRQVALNGSAPGGVTQVFDAIPETWLRVRFDYFNNDFGPPLGSVQLSGDGSAESFTAVQSSGTAYTARTFLYRVAQTQSALAITSTTPGGGGPVLDHVRVEPARPFVNGSFEDFRFPARAQTDLGIDNILLRGWVTTAGSVQHWSNSTFAPNLGSYSLHLSGSAGPGTLCQTFDVEAGASYDMLYDLASNPALAADQSVTVTVASGAATLATRNDTLNPAAVLAGQTRWRTRAISFTATTSSATLCFAGTTAGSTGLVLDNVRFGVAGTLNTTGLFNAFESTTTANAILGNIKTKIATSAVTLDIAAIKADKLGYSNFPMSGIKVELIDATDDSAPLDELSNCRTSWTPIATLSTNFSLAPADNGRKVFSFTTGEVRRNVRLKMSYPASGTPTHVGCSNDNFALRPAAFSGFAATDSNDSSPGTARVLNNAGTGGIVHRAGRPFTVIAQALDGAGATAAGYNGTPQLAVVGCVTPTGCTAGTLSGSAATTLGIVAGNAFTYSEAGSISVQLEDTSFADVDAGDSTQDERAIRLAAPATLGRFVPDRYRLTTATAPVMAHGTCGPGPSTQSFTFVGQNFGFATAPVVRATPLNAAGAALNNARPSFGASQVSSSFAAGGAPVALAGSPTVSGISAAGDALIYFSAATLSFARDANTPVPTFAPTFNLSVNLSDTSEPGATGPIDAEAPLAINNIGFGAGGGTFHYGRIVLRPAYADLRSDLFLPLEVQSYGALGWQTMNAAGSCVTAAATAFAYSQATGLLNAGSGTSTCASRVLNDAITVGGRASIRLPKPGGGAVPSSMTVTLNTGAAAGNSCTAGGATTSATSIAMPWLAGAAGAAPSTRVSWGAPRSEYLMLRERYD
jgi:parallel beta-helix repeat protein